MPTQERVYRATESGLEAVGAERPGLSFFHRCILRLLEGDTHFAVIYAGMAPCAESQVTQWLQQLEALGLVSSDSAGAESDLDFTSSLSLSALAEANRR